MGMRTYTYLLFLIAMPASAAVIENTADTIVPPVIVKAPIKLTTNTSGPKQIITQEQMSATGVTTLAQALQNLGGIQLQNTTGNDAQVLINMRGFGANANSNVLMLLNGIPLTNPDLMPPDLNVIPLNEIEYIEIVAGTESVLYGDQAVAGTINVVTKQRVKDKVDLTCGVGSFQQYNCAVAVFNHYQNLKYNVSLSNKHTDNYRDHNDYDQNVLLGGFSYLYGTGNIDFDYKLGEEDMQYPGALTAQQVRQDRQQANNDTDFFKDTNDYFHLRNQQYLTEHWQLETDLSRRDMHGHGVLTSEFTQSRNIYFLRPQLKGKYNDTVITTGLDVESDQYHLNSLYGLTDNTQQKYGAFGLLNYPIYTRTTLSAGLRGAEQTGHLESGTDSNNLNRAIATTLGLNYQFTVNANAYLRRAESFRFPKADENAFAPVGVTALRTQRGVAYESGVEWQNDQYVAKAGIYQLNLEDEIAFDPTQTPQTPFGSNVNLDPTVRRGLTISGKDQLIRQVAVDAQYNYVNAQFQNGIYAGNRIPLVAENILRGGVNYFFAEHWNAYTEAVYTGNQYAANDFGNVAGANGGYTLYNFHLRFIYQQLTAAFRLNNIFNTYYYYYTVYDSSSNSETFYPAAGRNFTLNVNYSFG